MLRLSLRNSSKYIESFESLLVLLSWVLSKWLEPDPSVLPAHNPDAGPTSMMLATGTRRHPSLGLLDVLPTTATTTSVVARLSSAKSSVMASLSTVTSLTAAARLWTELANRMAKQSYATGSVPVLKVVGKTNLGLAWSASFEIVGNTHWMTKGPYSSAHLAILLVGRQRPTSSLSSAASSAMYATSSMAATSNGANSSMNAPSYAANSAMSAPSYAANSTMSAPSYAANAAMSATASSSGTVTNAATLYTAKPAGSSALPMPGPAALLADWRWSRLRSNR